ncbi:CarboxypepD_reg-like domain-containing protein [Pricia antarctica]|uniref:CarboxypepD_reg-like domain-containing protein n=1 Tax=Pricia antarctica TaxID=641691 RepID=A0A1G6W314_9FLAO|nr:carboxypeptidase-like regulatory domain-containing protein [Pricia antarctica]SDD59435.1 CarboxypepD_reg-like domain-containing protein [Pricia antarctica]
MKKLLLIAFLANTAFIAAQNGGAILGKITDLGQNGEPMLMANVAVKNTNIARHTNFNGNFEITGIDSGSYVLMLSFAGYDTVEIPVIVSTNHTIKIEQGLSPKSISLDAELLSEIRTKNGEELNANAEK